MKYKRIKSVHGDYIVDYNVDFELTITTNHIVKESDDIEDLFDEFVKVAVDDKPQRIIRSAYEIYKHIITGEVLSNIAPFKLYGALWTREGLHYVAEYTKEGEWELL